MSQYSQAVDNGSKQTNQLTIFNTRASQSDGLVLEIPQFVPSVHKSTRHLSVTFAYATTKNWNDLTDNVRSAPSIHISGRD